jgi:D-3-phosphoglycerate dehydrogenase
MSDLIAITAGTIRDENNEVAQSLKERGYRLAIHSGGSLPTREELRALLAEASGFIAGSEPVTREVLAEAPKLRAISRHGVGYDNIDLDAATERGIVVTYTPDAMTDTVADLAIGMLLALARRLAELDAAMKTGAWVRGPGSDVGGRTLGVIGTGRIGMSVARRARAFRMRLVGCDERPNPLFVEELGGDYVPLDELLETADYITLHAPVLPSTRKLIRAETLARMKPAAFLINTSRGGLIDEEALLAALDEGQLAGAALDVFDTEPPSPGSSGDRLARHPRVLATPHIAAFTPATAKRMGRAAVANLLAGLAGERHEHVLNPAVYAQLRQGGERG